MEAAALISPQSWLLRTQLTCAGVCTGTLTHTHTHTPHREKRGHTSVSWYTQEHRESRSTLSRQVTKASKNSMSLDEHMAIHPRKERERQFLAPQTAQKQ